MKGVEDCRAIEGFMLRHVDGSIWVVKGCIHPSDGYVALPRYVDGVRFKKLDDALNYVLRYYRHYMRYLPEVGWTIPVIPLHEVHEVLNPIDTESRLRSSGSLLARTALELLKLITGGCSCVAGISGSLCGGYFRESSDIDIVVYSNYSTCYDLIRRLRVEGVLRPMDRHIAFMEVLEVSEVVDDWVVNAITLRNLQGTYKGFRYTIRLVRCEPPVVLSDYVVVPSTEAVIRITDSTLSYTTPAVYAAEVIASTTHRYGFRLVRVLTHRVRYSEMESGTLLLVNTPVYVSREWTLINLDIPGTRVRVLHQPTSPYRKTGSFSY